jgi:voltage-gated potassium channel
VTAPEQTRGERLVEWASGRQQRKGLRPRDAAVLIVSVWFLAIVVWGVVEHLVEPKTFPTVWLGMWWALETVTTVGYGDVVPMGTAGRIIASFLLLGGLAFLTVIIAMITGGFVARYQRQTSAAGEDRLVQRIEQLSLELKEVHAEVQGLRPVDNGPEAESRAQAGRAEPQKPAIAQDR